MVSLLHHPEGTHQVPWAAHVAPYLSPDHPDKRGQALCVPQAGDPGTQGSGVTEECMDLGRHMEALRHKSLRALISCAQSGTHPEPRLCDKRDPEGGPTEEDGGGGRQDRDTSIIAPPPPLYKESWHLMKGWYKATDNRAPPPAWLTFKWIIEACVALYWQVPPPGENIPISTEPFQVDYSVPTEDKIEWLVPRLRSNRSGGPSGVRV